MNFLRYTPGSKPGVAPKRKADPEERKEQKRQYEAKRPVREFQPAWKQGRPWLELSTEGAGPMMFCRYCRNLAESEATPGVRGGSHGSDKFVSGTSNFKISMVSEHETTARHKRVITYPSQWLNAKKT